MFAYLDFERLSKIYHTCFGSLPLMFSVALKGPKLLVPFQGKLSPGSRNLLEQQSLTHPKEAVRRGKDTCLSAKLDHNFHCEHSN